MDSPTTQWRDRTVEQVLINDLEVNDVVILDLDATWDDVIGVVKHRFVKQKFNRYIFELKFSNDTYGYSDRLADGYKPDRADRHAKHSSMSQELQKFYPCGDPGCWDVDCGRNYAYRLRTLPGRRNAHCAERQTYSISDAWVAKS